MNAAGEFRDTLRQELKASTLLDRENTNLKQVMDGQIEEICECVPSTWNVQMLCHRRC
jgi:hypothetical protein